MSSLLWLKPDDGRISRALAATGGSAINGRLVT
jgi:hypothetical protein